MLMIYLVSINIITFIIYGYDKLQAIRNSKRIKEKTLIVLVIFGGHIGAILAMIICHHKINKPKFVWGIPILFLIEFLLLIFCIN